MDEWLDADLARQAGRPHGGRRPGRATATNFVQPHVDDRVVIEIGGDRRVEHLGTRSSYTYQLEAFATAVRTGTPMPTDAADAVTTMRMIDDCYRAAGLSPRPSLDAG